MRANGYNSKTHVGAYIGNFIQKQGLGIKSCAVEAEIKYNTLYAIVKGNCNIGLKAYFRIAEYMSRKTLIPIEHYLRRLHEEYNKGKIKNEK